MKSWLTKNSFILLILTLVFVLRIPAVTDGLPAVYNPTEYFLLKIAMSMGARISPDPLFYVYPPFFSYLLVALYGGFYLFGQFFGIFPDREAFAVEFLVSPDNFYIIGRCLSLIFMLLTVLVTYKYVARYRGETPARFAAGLTAAILTCMEFSASVTPEMLLLFWSTLVVLYYLPLREQPKPARIFIAGLLAGLATGTKYNAGFLTIGLFIFVVQHRKTISCTLSKGLAIAAGGMLAGFFIPNFHILLASDAYLTGLFGLLEQMYYAPTISRNPGFAVLLQQLIGRELILGLIFIIVMFYFLTTRVREYLHLLAPLFLTFIIVMTWSKTGLDYLLPVYPIWIFLTAQYISDHMPGFQWQRILYLIIFLPSVFMQGVTTIRWIKADTREQATEWLMNTLETGDRICYDQSHYDLGLYDIKRFTEYGAGAAILPDKIKQRLEVYGTSRRQVSFVPIMFEACPSAPSGYLGEYIRYERKTFDRLLAENVTYLITNDRFYDLYLPADPVDYAKEIRPRIVSVKQFYRKLSAFEPVVRFEPDFWHNGPELAIYQFKNSGAAGE